MKTTFTFLLLWLLTLPCMAQWIELDPGIDVPYFSDVYAITPDIVVVVGANGIILKTTDGGETWQQKPSGTTNGLSKVQFSTPDTGYVIGSNGLLLKTTNGGETWDTIEIDETINLYSLSCLNENLIFISTNNGLIKSENGGQNWTVPAPMPYYEAIQFVTNEIGFVGDYFWSNYENKFAKTDNSGASWQEIEALAPFHFLNENIGFYFLGGLYKTVNGGNQFNLITDIYGEGNYETLLDIFAVNENTVWGILYWETLDWATPIRGIIKISETETDGYSIYMFPHIHDFYLETIHFADETTGYVVGRNDNGGIIWKNGTGINEPLSVKDHEEVSFSIYPNPASEELYIRINNFHEDFQVTLSDKAGAKIYSQAFSNQRKIRIDTSTFATGIYILTIKNKQQTYSRKIIIQ